MKAFPVNCPLFITPPPSTPICSKIIPPTPKFYPATTNSQNYAMSVYAPRPQPPPPRTA